MTKNKDNSFMPWWLLINTVAALLIGLWFGAAFGLIAGTQDGGYKHPLFNETVKCEAVK